MRLSPWCKAGTSCNISVRYLVYYRWLHNYTTVLYLYFEMNNCKGFKVGVLNIRSLWPNIDEFRINFADFDSIGVCETWLNSAVTNEMICLYKHKLFRLDRNTGKCGGGLALYLNDVLFESSCILQDYTNSTADLEQLWVCISAPNTQRKIVGIVYRPPAGNAEKCLELLRCSMESVQANHNAEITVMGDLNINYKNRNSAPFKLLKEIECDFGLKQLIETGTRITSQSATVIDLILTDCVHVSDSGVLNIYISDHLPVYYVRKKSRERNTKKMVTGRSYKKNVKTDYQNDVRDHINWEDYWINGQNVNQLWDVFGIIWYACADVHCPVVKMYVNDICLYWYSRELIEEINFKNHLYRKSKATQSTDDWSKFQVQKNVTKRLLFLAKDNYVNEQIELNQNDSKKLWRNINTLTGLGKNKSASGLKEVKDVSGKLITNQEAADYMNDF